MAHHTAYGISDSRSQNSLDIAAEAFTALVTGPAPLSVNGRAFPGLPARVVPLDEVRDRLEVPGFPEATRDAVWSDLVRRAHTGAPAWLVGCAGLALPHLTRIAAKLAARFHGDPTDIHDGVLSGFLTAVAEADPDQPRLPTRLWWAARRAGEAALREARSTPIPTDAPFLSRPPVRPWGHEDLILARAVADGVLTQTEADLIGATRLEDGSLTDWADRHGVGHWAAYKIRKRAENRLLSYLLDGGPTAEAHDPVAVEAITAIALHGTQPASPVPGSTTTSHPSSQSRSVTGGSFKKSCEPVSKNGSKSGEQGCGRTAPAARHSAVLATPSLRSPEVRSCA
jgi:hypothetical protein